MRSFIRSRHMCDWEDFERRPAFVRARLAESEGARVSPFLLLAEPGVSAAEQRISSELWMRARLAAARDERQRLNFKFPQRRNNSGPIRLGYLSSDFHDHPTALLLIEMLEAHDPRHFELHAYSYGADDGKRMRPQLVSAFDRFTDIGAMSDSEAAQAIHRDGIDILVDLKGFTEGTRTSILALRPAPVQVNFLGYPGTLGPGLCDYIITDEFCTPAAAAEDYDRVLRLLAALLSAARTAQPARRRPVARRPRAARRGLCLLLLQPILQIDAGGVSYLAPPARRRPRQRSMADDGAHRRGQSAQ